MTRNKMIIWRMFRRDVLLVGIFFAAFLLCRTVGAEQKIDPRLIGCWQAQVAAADGGKYPLTWDIFPNGRLCQGSVGSSPVQNMRGMIEADGGKWKAVFDNGKTDAGAYKIVGRDTISVTTENSSIEFMRLDASFSRIGQLTVGIFRQVFAVQNAGFSMVSFDFRPSGCYQYRIEGRRPVPDLTGMLTLKNNHLTGSQSDGVPIDFPLSFMGNDSLLMERDGKPQIWRRQRDDALPDPGLVGHWHLDLTAPQGPARRHMTISANGFCENLIESTQGYPGEYFLLEARNGNWNAYFAGKDPISYSYDQPDSSTLHVGAVTWKRAAPESTNVDPQILGRWWVKWKDQQGQVCTTIQTYHANGDYEVRDENPQGANEDLGRAAAEDGKLYIVHSNGRLEQILYRINGEHLELQSNAQAPVYVMNRGEPTATATAVPAPSQEKKPAASSVTRPVVPSDQSSGQGNGESFKPYVDTSGPYPVTRSSSWPYEVPANPSTTSKDIPHAPKLPPPSPEKPGPKQEEFDQGAALYEAGNMADAFTHFLIAAKAGHVKAQLQVGWHYDKGQGVTMNKAEAIAWYTKAAQAGDPTAQCNLARSYRDGNGVSQDYSKSFQWFQKSAAQNAACGYYGLGYLYEFGLGVNKDLRLAADNYGIAGELGDSNGEEAAQSIRAGYRSYQNEEEAQEAYQEQVQENIRSINEFNASHEKAVQEYMHQGYDRVGAEREAGSHGQ